MEEMPVDHDINPLGFAQLSKMSRVVIGSLLAGAGAIVLGFYLVHSLQASSHAAFPDWSWDVGTGRVKLGGGTSTSQGWQLTLDDSGRGLLVVPIPSLEAPRYPFLHLQFSTQAAAADSLGIFWKTAQTGEHVAQYWIYGAPEKSPLLPMGGMDDWAGDLVELAIFVQGAPGAKIVIDAIELLPDSPDTQFKAFYSDWNAFVPWAHTSINKHEAVRSWGTTLYPVVVVATLLAASLLAYGILVLLRTGTRLDWRVVSSIFLFCWISLDLVWQKKLWQQLDLTHAQFAGTDIQARLAVGPDAALVQFMTSVQQHLDPGDTRIFVGSKDDFTGMRGSYYLYPFNVFWRRHASELPDRKYIHRGDYIVLIYPSDIRFDPQQHALLTPDKEVVSVELLAEEGVGSLYRVM